MGQRLRACSGTVLAALALLLLWAAPSRAAEAGGGATACPAALLNQLLVSATVDAGAPAPKLLWDRVFALEESYWPEPDRFTSFGVLRLDFGAPRRATSIVIQSEADSPFVLGFSEDGKSWVSLEAPALPDKTGMASRQLPAPPTPFRYVELRASGKGARVACAELQLLCDADVVRLDSDKSSRRLAEEQTVVAAEAALDEQSLARSLLVPLCLALTLCLLFVKRKVAGSRRARAVWLAALGLTALCAFGGYLKLGPYGLPPHRHELFHYELGSKYFAELGYDGLYDCALAAELDAGFADRVLASSYRDLRAGALISGGSALKRAARCRDRFAPERWQEFSGDVGYFARALGGPDFRKVLRDHGYNPSPLWTLIGSVAERAFGTRPLAPEPASPFHAHPFLPLLDVPLLLGIVAVVGAGFGFESACLVVVALACNTLADPSWTRGAFLRFDWLFLLFAGLALWRRERPGLGAFCFALAAGLRVFPALALLPLAVLGAHAYVKKRVVPRELRRAAVGVAAGVVVVLAITASYPGLASWGRFFEHLRTHAESVSQNMVGWRTLLSYRPSTRASLLFEPNAADPFAAVIRARWDNLRPLLPVYWGGIAAALGLLVRGLLRRFGSKEGRARVPFELPLAGLLLVGLVVDLSSYYFAVLAAFALGARGVIPLFGLLAGLSLLPLLGPLDDTSYAMASAAVGAWLFWQLWALGSERTPETASVPPPAEAPPTADGPWLPDARYGAWSLQQWVLGLVAVLAVVGVGRAALGAWTCDDAYISFRYAENLVAGKGLVYNAGERVEGFTNLLFTLIVAAGLAVSVSAVVTALVVGLVAYLGVAVTLLAFAHATRRAGRIWVPVAALIWLIQDDLGSWATGGLETSLFTLLALGGIVALLRAEGRPRRLVLSGALLGLACATRPDGVVFAAVGLAAAAGLAWARARSVRALVTDCGWLGLPLAAIGAALVAFKLGYYGSLLPATYYAKSALDAHYAQGALYVGLYFFKHWPLTLALVGLPVLLVRSRLAAAPRLTGDLLVLGACAATFLVYVMHSAGDFMFARRLVPAIPFVLLSIELLLSRLDGFNATLLAGLLAVLSFVPRRLYPDQAPLRIHGIANERDFYPPETMALRAAQGRLAGAVLTGAPVKAAFAGGMCIFAYYSKLPNLIEPNGLTNLELAKASLKRRGELVGHEKAASRATLRRMGVELLFQQTEPAAETPAYNQAFFGEHLWAEILRYDRAVMTELARVPGVRFVPIEVTLAEGTKVLGTAPCPVARGTLARLDDFYLGSDPIERRRLAGLVDARCPAKP